MFKRRIFEIIQPDRGNSLLSRVFDWFITALILISVVCVFAVTFDLPKGVLSALETVEAVASIVFTVEYLLRLWTANLLYDKLPPLRARGRYVFSTMAVIDLVSILPFWLPMFVPMSMLGLRALRLVRLLRILKLNRYFDALKTIGGVIADKKRELVGSLFFVILLMLVSSLLMYSTEHDAQPEVFRNAFSGLWWAVATLTTVGYGDIYPVTVLGRLLGAFIAFSGIAALAIPTGIITAGLTERIGHERTEEDVQPGRKNTVSGSDEELHRLLCGQKELLEVIAKRIGVSAVKDGQEKR